MVKVRKKLQGYDVTLRTFYMAGTDKAQGV